MIREVYTTMVYQDCYNMFDLAGVGLVNLNTDGSMTN